VKALTVQTILVVDDDPHIREVVCYALDNSGYRATAASNGQQAIGRFNEGQVDLLVLDIMMPEMDGTDVCREIRKTSSVPIIFLSAKEEEIDKVVSLELGGDDYVTKPFSPRELVARVRAVLRRTDGSVSSQPTLSGIITYGDLRLDPESRQVFWGENEIMLTRTEFGIVKTLLSQPKKVFSRDEIMDGAYDHVNHTVTDRAIDSHVRNIRKKFKAKGCDQIKTVRGVGFRLKKL
jgi:two-component system OmpR family response regulator